MFKKASIIFCISAVSIMAQDKLHHEFKDHMGQQINMKLKVDEMKMKFALRKISKKVSGKWIENSDGELILE